jgi:hypothetical protein
MERYGNTMTIDDKKKFFSSSVMTSTRASTFFNGPPDCYGVMALMVGHDPGGWESLPNIVSQPS